MKYVGLHTQIQKNNRKSLLLLAAFPLLILIGVYVVLFILNSETPEQVTPLFLTTTPIVLVLIGIWFIIAYFFNSQLIQHAVQSRPLERRENMRVYNLTENLCMSVGMKMPKLYVIDSPALNAFASGINDKTFAVTLTSGLIDSLNDDELEGVIAHELTHIRNKDVRLLIVTIVFVGIFGVIVDVLFRNLLYSNSSRRRDDKGGSPVILVILLVAVVLYFFSMIFKFALSRSREYMADAGAVEMTKNAPALANALRKVSGNSVLDTTNNEVKELFLDNGSPEDSKSFFSSVSSIFATHPPIEKRIKVLEQY
jgi:heat shock protein HtpX